MGRVWRKRRLRESSILDMSDHERDVFFRKFNPLVYKLACRYGITQDVREEVLGVLFIEFDRSVKEFDPERGVPLEAFLVTRLWKAAYGHARLAWKWRNRRADLGVLDVLGIGADDRLDSGWLDSWEHDERVARAQRMIDSLPPRQKAILTMKYGRDLSFEEISRLLSMKQVSVRSSARHGLNRLRARLVES